MSLIVIIVTLCNLIAGHARGAPQLACWSGWLCWNKHGTGWRDEWAQRLLAASVGEITGICIPPDRDGGMGPRRRG